MNCLTDISSNAGNSLDKPKTSRHFGKSIFRDLVDKNP